MTTPYLYINSTGTVVPDPSEILTTVNTEYQTTFGADIQPRLLIRRRGSYCGGNFLARADVVQNDAALWPIRSNPNVASRGFSLTPTLALTGMQRAADPDTGQRA